MKRLRTPSLPPTWHRHWEALSARTQAWWSQLAPRERKLMMMCGTVALGSASWLLLIEPAATRVQHWQVELPRLRTLTTEVEAELRGAQTDRVARSSASAAALPAALTQSLDAARLQGMYEVVRLNSAAGASTGAAQWQVTFTDAPARMLVPWLLQAPLELNLVPVSITLARVDALPQTGTGLTFVPRGKPAANRSTVSAPATDTPSTPPTEFGTATSSRAGTFSGIVVLGPDPKNVRK